MSAIIDEVDYGPLAQLIGKWVAKHMGLCSHHSC